MMHPQHLLNHSFCLSILFVTAFLLLGNQLSWSQEPENFHVMTYNIHHGKDAAGLDRLEEMADLILRSGVDIVGLQEVDSVCTRSGGVDQTAYLAQKTGMYHEFVRHFEFQGGAYGLSILSKYPILDVQVDRLPVQSDVEGTTVALMTALIKISDHDTIRVSNVHMDYRSQASRMRQSSIMVELLKESSLPLILMGDLNTIPSTAELGRLQDGLQLSDSGEEQAYTFPAEIPDRRIDFILFSPEFSTVLTKVLHEPYSDHLAVISALSLSAPNYH